MRGHVSYVYPLLSISARNLIFTYSHFRLTEVAEISPSTGFPLISHFYPILCAVVPHTLCKAAQFSNLLFNFFGLTY
jgi:hypothetical protein